MTDQPTHQAVDRHRRVGSHAPAIDLLDVSTAGADDDAPNAGVSDEHVRPAAEQCDGDAVFSRELQAIDHLLRRAWLDEEVRRTADFESRQRGEWNVSGDAIAAKPGDKGVTERIDA
jgi:hypothetical protein